MRKSNYQIILELSKNVFESLFKMKEGFQKKELFVLLNAFHPSED